MLYLCAVGETRTHEFCLFLPQASSFMPLRRNEVNKNTFRSLGRRIQSYWHYCYLKTIKKKHCIIPTENTNYGQNNSSHFEGPKAWLNIHFLANGLLTKKTSSSMLENRRTNITFSHKRDNFCLLDFFFS